MRKMLPALTSLRFFAAAAIVIQHGTAYFKIGEGIAHKFILIQGLTFFFVLSGFILTYCYPKLEKISHVFDFIWARICRIWPAHLVTLTIFSLIWIGYAGYTPTLNQTIANIFLTQAWHPEASYYFAFNGVTWTLSVEMFFYCMFPLLIWGWKDNWLIKLVICAMLVLLAGWIAFSTKAPFSGGIDSATWASWLYIWPPVHLLEFALGMTAALAWFKYENIFHSVLIITLFEIGAFILVFWASTHMPAIGDALIKEGILPSVSQIWFSVSAPAPFFALLLFVLALGKGYISKFLSLACFVRLGEISFSLYLIHQLVERILEVRGHTWFYAPEWLQYSAYWCFILLASYLMWRFIEKPSQKILYNPIKYYPIVFFRNHSNQV